MTGDRPFSFVLLEMTLLVLLGPLVTGTIQKMKARLQCRQGAGVLQPYRDLAKLFRKGTVQADTASGLFRSIPVLVLAATVAAGALVPVVRVGPPAVPLGDALMLLGLLALARFLTAVGALDAGGAFGGMGASREMTIAPLVEPVLMMVVFSTAVAAGTTELGALAAHRGTQWLLASHTRQIVTLALVSALFFPAGPPATGPASLVLAVGTAAGKILVLANR